MSGSAGFTLTDRQAEVLRIVAAHPRTGVSAAKVRDLIYPEDSPMRTKRTGGRHGANACGQLGGIGNLSAGRILAALERKGAIRRGDPGMGESEYRFYIGAL